ncbi:MAG TPA: hypothetical protein VEC12_04755 [Bacteroidia bacterium]|nr:hypothetical protein [Bacteroidia bacterium]
MLATLFSYEIILGTVELSIVDKSMGVVGGTLSPSDNYYAFSKIFKKRSNSERPEIVNLNLQLQNGCFLFPSNIVVFEYESPSAVIEVSALGIHNLIIENFFKNNDSIFLIEPWGVLSIKQKIALENELLTEIKVNVFTRLANWFKKKKSHPLNKFTFSAIGASGRNDEVLFEIRNKDSEYCYAVVHLTWSNKLEKSFLCAGTSYYKDFDEFKYFKMYPDRNEWES